ncbi:type II toxin-antitoxin system Phd/YefM family antitoxin [Cyanobium sp. CH-040]|uniref:type II toxin-antitoxin system Phd/YefM family antitoxin n=1 Tax=Cyanobium sp. CH-040 TaxID=2823708 RepID=UPI0020CEC46F|nr:type II toxin-antitoxin system prevent-host-death family antitoxin [Cyanobium sp. CH-040]
MTGLEPVMRQVNMHEAKTHLSRLVDEAAAGQSFVICKAGRPMVRVTPLSEEGMAAAPVRRLGLLAGQCQVPDDFVQMGAA